MYLHMCAHAKGLGHLTVLFLATILSSFLAMRTSSSAGPMPAAGRSLAGFRRPVEPNQGGSGQSWALPAWGCGQRWEGDGVRSGGKRAEGERGEKKKGGGKESEGKGRESRKEVGLSRPVINSCQAGEIARGRAKYS